MEKTPLKFVWKYVKIFKWFFITMFLLLLAGNICGQIYPYFLAKIYDTVAGKVGEPNYWSDIIEYTFIGFFLGFLKVLFVETSMFFNYKCFPPARTMILRDAFDYVNKHSISFFNQEMSGNIANKVNQLDNGVLEVFNSIMNTFYTVMVVIVSSVLLGVISLYYLPIMFLWYAMMLLSGFYLGKLRSQLSKETSKQQSHAHGMIVDSLANYSEIKSFANFKFERFNLLKYLRILRSSETKEQKRKALIHATQNVIMMFSLLFFMLLSIWLFKNNQINTTEFIFVNTIFMTMSNAVFEISWTYNNISRAFGQLGSALDTLSVDPIILDKKGAKSLRATNANITFDNVSFAYDGKNNIFEDLSLNIKAGEKVGLVGTSGAGKSTFVKLIARYFDVNSGAISINNIDVRDVTQDSLRKNIATIPQDVCLFNRTLLENIRYGKTGATDEEVMIAAQKASADDFIKSFPDGYQTKVGDRGVVLSGGERQRIAIARAILKDAPILIFDEATSALDSTSEEHIQQSLSKLMEDKTVIAIAHRLSTLREMDRILVLEDGKIVEEGSHLSLLRKKGVYYNLYNMQANGFVGVSDFYATPAKVL